MVYMMVINHGFRGPLFSDKAHIKALLASCTLNRSAPWCSLSPLQPHGPRRTSDCREGWTYHGTYHDTVLYDMVEVPLICIMGDVYGKYMEEWPWSAWTLRDSDCFCPYECISSMYVCVYVLFYLLAWPSAWFTEHPKREKILEMEVPEIGYLQIIHL